MAQTLDFRPKEPTLNEKIYEAIEHQGKLMERLHLMVLALLRRMVDKKLITPEEFTLMTADRAVNDDFVLMLGMVAEKLDAEIAAQAAAGMKLDYRPTFMHRVKAFLTGKKLEVRMKKEYIEPGPIISEK